MRNLMFLIFALFGTSANASDVIIHGGLEIEVPVKVQPCKRDPDAVVAFPVIRNVSQRDDYLLFSESNGAQFIETHIHPIYDDESSNTDSTETKAKHRNKTVKLAANNEYDFKEMDTHLMLHKPTTYKMTVSMCFLKAKCVDVPVQF